MEFFGNLGQRFLDHCRQVIVATRFLIFQERIGKLIMRNRTLILFLAGMVWLTSCKEDSEDPPNSNPPDVTDTTAAVNVNLDELPYENLSEYNFFIGDQMSDLIPNEGVLLYEPITPLFTDYAKKSRYVWMPEGTSASYVEDFETFSFPDGAVLIKNFYYDEVLPFNEKRVMETRIIFKRNGSWEFAEYIWNNQQTEATFDLDGRSIPIEFVRENGETIAFNYRVPSEPECLTCHKIDTEPWPNGPKPQNLNSDLEYQEGIMNQLMKWAEVGYLDPTYPDDIETIVDWEDETADLRSRVRSYLDANCGHCHKENAHCAYRNIRLDYKDNDRDNNLGICVPFDEFVPGQPLTIEHIIESGDASASMLVYRMSSEEENVQMPLIGKSLIHEEGLDLITQYINSLEQTCP